jgi:hypothetical protein
MRPLAWLGLLLAALVHGTIPMNAQPLTCSTWQGITTCSSPGGYVAHEWDRDGMTIGQDSDGRRWATSRWQGIDATTVTPPGWNGR